MPIGAFKSPQGWKESWPVWAGISVCSICLSCLIAAHLSPERTAGSGHERQGQASPGADPQDLPRKIGAPLQFPKVSESEGTPARATPVRLPAPEIEEPGAAAIPPAEPARDHSPSRKPVSDLQRKTADWRYEGFLESAQGNRAVIRRMEIPDHRALIRVGDRLEGILVESIDSDRLVALQDRESVSIPLTTTAAFDLSDLEIPAELADSPETLASIVFSQTLGPYLADLPEEDWVDRVKTEETETLQAVTQSFGLPSSRAGESPEEWAQRLADDPSGVFSQETIPNPILVPLSEESRLRFLGAR